MTRTTTHRLPRLLLCALVLLGFSWQAHAQRQALSLDGNGFASAADAPELDISGNAITMEAWIKHDGQSNEDAIILNKGTDEEGYQLAFFGSGEEPAVRFAISDLNNSCCEIVSNAGIPAGKWTHVAATYEGSQLALYIDGELDNTRNFTRTVGENDDPLRIGTNNAGTGRFYSGVLDDIRIWNVGRNRFDMEESLFNPPTGDEGGLMAYYTFDDVSAWPVPDLAGSNNPFVAVGSAPLVVPGIYPVPPTLFALSENAQVELQWNERLGPNGENAAAQFKMYRSTTPDGTDRTELATIDGATTSYTDADVDNGTLYYYEVTSLVDGQESDFSKMVVARPYATRGGGGLSLPYSNYATMSDRPSLDGGDQSLVNFDKTISLEAWIQHDGESDENAILVNKGTTEEGYQLAFFGSGEEPAVRFAVSDLNNSCCEIVSNAGIPAGQWTHVAATYDGAQLELYVNGVLDNTRDFTRSVGQNGDPLRIGADNGGTGRFYSGQLDELRFWNVARTEQEVAASYRDELVGDEEGLIAYFRFNDAGSPYAQSSETQHETMELLGAAAIAAPGVFPMPPYGYANGEDAAAELLWHERDDEATSQFKVYRSTQPDGTDRMEVATVTDGTSFTDTVGENGILYYYEITGVDANGQESDYTYVDPALISDMRGGTTLVLDGVDDFATLTDRPSLDGYAQSLVNFDKTISLEAWIKHDGESDENAILVNKGTTEEGYQLAFVGSGEEPAVRFAVSDLNNSCCEIVSNAGIPAGQWTHVAATYDGAQLELYVNGVLDNTRDFTRSVGHNVNPFRIGTDNGGTGRFYGGELDELRLWNVARTEQEVAAHYNQELVGDEEGLISYLRFNEPGSMIAHSSATRAMTADLVNGAIMGSVSALPTDAPAAVPEEVALRGNYPNPFRASTTIRYALPEAGHVRITVYDALGRQVATLENAQRTAGEHEVTLDAAELPSGVYLYRLDAGTAPRSQTMLLVR